MVVGVGHTPRSRSGPLAMAIRSRGIAVVYSPAHRRATKLATPPRGARRPRQGPASRATLDPSPRLTRAAPIERRGPGRVAAGSSPAPDRGLTPRLGRRDDRRAERDEPVNGHRVRLASTPAVRVFSPLSARPPLNRGRPRADEEDLSAQEARQEAGTRLPRSHGFEGWSPRARPTPREGAQAAHRLTRTGHHVPAFSALRRKADFDALGRRGSVRSTRLLVLRSLRTDRPETRIGMSTPKSLGGAVQRNRVRRRLRELIRERRDALGAGWDLLLIARPEAGTASYVELREALGSLLERSGIGR
jgi:ribonuclease P protein component